MICYVILHYKNIEVTIQCVESILRISSKSNSTIIIVDNGSNNGSYEDLAKKYGSCQRIYLIQNKVNLGFAKGNNVGYQFAKMYLNPKIVVICNNDLIFEQDDFEDALENAYRALKFDVAGPDIVNLDGMHQNPHRSHMLTLKQIKRMNIKKSLFLLYLNVKKKIPLLDKMAVLENAYEKGRKNNNNSYKINDSVVLQGSCIIFTERFIANEEMAFCPDTFLYFEEDLLALKCLEKGYKSVVCNQVTVKHLEGQSTEKSEKNNVNRMIFVIRNMIESGKIYEHYIIEYNYFFRHGICDSFESSIYRFR